ncbi:DUF6286 domain-containing protein [Umezawaea sp. Da 62-37]|uniref:DUF6286 domain-containing protein n=1 Tax=Umezawaea sp. Da 62-37 TaxID=3075927 RepID=UPI0028F6DC13|nr:DUF6286 domain-containing protein [Umezawaea sp. Da 62-37]WNV88448.1 DUF6286 domain-containing protein [Umezawaea sp. Da 62-37]
MIRRPRRSVPATLTAIVLLAVCVATATWTVQKLIGRTPYVPLPNPHWNDLSVAIAGGVLAVLGLVMLMAAVLPGKPMVVPLTEDESDAGASTRSLRTTLQAAADSVDGVTATKLKVRRGKVIAKVRTNRTNTDGLDDAVRAALDQRLSQIPLVAPPSPRIRTRSAR